MPSRFCQELRKVRLRCIGSRKRPSSASTAPSYRRSPPLKSARRNPTKEQVERNGQKLRPVAEVLSFVGGHPEGVTAGGRDDQRLPERQ